MTNPLRMPDQFQLGADNPKPDTDEENQRLLDEVLEPNEDEPDDDPETDDSDKSDDEPAPNFGGFEEPEQSDTSPHEDPLLAEMQNMTPEAMAELAKTDPQKALEMAVTAVLQKKNIRSFDASEVVNATRSVITVQQVRETIGEQFKPHKHPKLRERAQQIYKERGFDIRTNPTAELDAFVLAAHEHPEWLEDSEMPEDTRNEPPRSGRRKSSSKSITPRLSSEDLEIASRMGIDIRDGKAMKRLANIKGHFQKRLRD